MTNISSVCLRRALPPAVAPIVQSQRVSVANGAFEKVAEPGAFALVVGGASDAIQQAYFLKWYVF